MKEDLEHQDTARKETSHRNCHTKIGTPIGKKVSWKTTQPDTTFTPAEVPRMDCTMEILWILLAIRLFQTLLCVIFAVSINQRFFFEEYLCVFHMHVVTCYILDAFESNTAANQLSALYSVSGTFV